MAHAENTDTENSQIDSAQEKNIEVLLLGLLKALIEEQKTQERKAE